MVRLFSLGSMSQPQSTFRRRFLLSTILAGLHTALVIVAPLGGGDGHEGMGGFVWLLFYYLDFPASLLLAVFEIQPEIFFLLIGIVYWGLVGFLIQSGWRWLSRSADAQK